MIKIIGGGFCLLLGSTIAIWVCYNLFVERQPEAENHSPIPAVGFVMALFYVGPKWIREGMEGFSAPRRKKKKKRPANSGSKKTSAQKRRRPRIMDE